MNKKKESKCTKINKGSQMNKNDMSDNELEIRDRVACAFGWRDFDHYRLNADSIGDRMDSMFEYIMELIEELEK